MNCEKCGRKLKRAATRIGHWAYGPVCAQRLDLLEPKTPRQLQQRAESRKARKAIRQAQCDLFDDFDQPKELHGRDSRASF
jgi:hypothetical protein